jgi:hypothetical protein
LNLGCDLDARVHRIDPPATVDWYDVDFPAVIELSTSPPRRPTGTRGSPVRRGPDERLAAADERGAHGHPPGVPHPESPLMSPPRPRPPDSLCPLPEVLSQAFLCSP